VSIQARQITQRYWYCSRILFLTDAEKDAWDSPAIVREIDGGSERIRCRGPRPRLGDLRLPWIRRSIDRSGDRRPIFCLPRHALA